MLMNGVFAKASVALVLLFCAIVPHSANALPRYMGKGYCLLRHPVEALTSERTACESQHVIQRQSGGGDEWNTIWVNTAAHTYLDRSNGQPWDVERPYFDLGNDDIQRAYMIGTHSLGYNFYIYDHHGEGTMTLFKWDAATHLLYTWAAIVNLPQKEVGYFASQVYRFHQGRPTQFIDGFIGIFIDMVEVLLGIIYGLLAVVVGLVLQPVDSISNIFALFGYFISTTFDAIAELIFNVWSLAFYGKRA